MEKTISLTSKRYLFYIALALVILISGCASSRHVPDGQLLLDRVNIEVNDSTHTLDATEFTSYLRQLPNHKILWSAKFRLGVYNMSGSDTTKWWNRWIRKLGEAPIIYDCTLMEAGKQQIERALVNKGFLNASVEVDSIINTKKKKIKLNYKLQANHPYTIDSIIYNFPDSVIRNLVLGTESKFPVKRGVHLDIDLLETERNMITEIMKNNGYYGFAKENISFNADTTANSHAVELTVNLSAVGDSTRILKPFTTYSINHIYFVEGYNPEYNLTVREIKDSFKKIEYKDIEVLYPEKLKLRPAVLYENCFLKEGGLYEERLVDRTYKALARLSILKFVNIRFRPIVTETGDPALDAYVFLSLDKSQSASFELEGTNSEGDLGVAAAVTYTHRNIGKGSEVLSAKLRGAYESLSGDLEGLIHDRYMEYSADIGLTFPKFKAPFLSERFKRKINATSELNLSMTYQERPEYTRIVSNAGWSYKWIHNRNKNVYIFTPIDINYVYLPESTYDFIDLIAPDNPLLRYSYEDHFIMRLGFSFYHSNKHDDDIWNIEAQRSVYTIRANIEFAGNLLYLLNTIIRPRPHVSEDPYKIFGIHYSQYFRLNSDFTYLYSLDPRSSFAAHIGFGLGYPYGNSTILPFEKRFYGGGANGVRGWDVRTLGPGRYPGTNSVSDFINQCGDIRFILSGEFRTKLVWVMELAAFIDIGNIWTIKNYPNQPEGLFRFNSFYKELAAAYGLGLRFDFNYFLVRFDLGMKAHNPAIDQIAWPLIHPSWHRDSSFHFSIGYPF